MPYLEDSVLIIWYIYTDVITFLTSEFINWYQIHVRLSYLIYLSKVWSNSFIFTQQAAWTRNSQIHTCTSITTISQGQPYSELLSVFSTEFFQNANEAQFTGSVLSLHTLAVVRSESPAGLCVPVTEADCPLWLISSSWWGIWQGASFLCLFFFYYTLSLLLH